eukprot:TRINITY_DN22862_c0_g1_i1.p1 TRINITY_DN22862_c0_g1~~TRINITY_DN22862_c0_g1_i1.p1  ORF type:complete len:196 (+),score=21.90 TRINITY_DN22862_c0_g1_i1:61-648(+)
MCIRDRYQRRVHGILLSILLEELCHCLFNEIIKTLMIVLQSYYVVGTLKNRKALLIACRCASSYGQDSKLLCFKLAQRLLAGNSRAYYSAEQVNKDLRLLFPKNDLGIGSHKDSELKELCSYLLKRLKNSKEISRDSVSVIKDYMLSLKWIMKLSKKINDEQYLLELLDDFNIIIFDRTDISLSLIHICRCRRAI